MDKREFTRVEFLECASVWFGNDVFFGDIKDVSLRGMYLLANHEVPINSDVSVKVYQTSRDPIYVKGCVVRCEQTGMGIQISKLDFNSFVNLRDLITMKCKDSDQIMQESYKMSAYIN